VGLAIGGAKDLNPDKARRKLLKTVGCCQSMISTGETSVKEENKERNTSQLQGLLCRTRMTDATGPSLRPTEVGEWLFISGMNTRIRGHYRWSRLASGHWLGCTCGGH